ncbi:MAG: PIG-L family deacetylase [Lentimicrobiaceae bacterium]|jgi:LmbE family N-acetylglucosaminyl deacetylase|nr:PIG-L family deacetylase [Lentimicrobiaceae bacterium]
MRQIKKKILVIAAHPDDEILGCGGTMARHTDNGDKVFTLFLSDGATSRIDKNNHIVDNISRVNAGISASKILCVNPPKFLNMPDNRMDTLPFLDIVKKVESIINEINPEVIYTHHFGDLNIDHQITHKAVMTAARPQPNCSVREIYSFEVLSSTEWSTPSPELSFVPNFFVNISTTLDQKLLALKAYSDEMRDFPHSRSVESVVFLARYRGATMGMNAAEAFKVERILN